jgi:hypothetical protein
MKTLDETLDSIMQLDSLSREMLLDILQRRQIEERRKEIAHNGKQARADYKSGKIVAATASDIISTLNSLRDK